MTSRATLGDALPGDSYSPCDEVIAYLMSQIDPRDPLNQRYATITTQIDVLRKAKANIAASATAMIVQIEQYQARKEYET